MQAEETSKEEKVDYLVYKAEEYGRIHHSSKDEWPDESAHPYWATPMSKILKEAQTHGTADEYEKAKEWCRALQSE